MGDKTEQGLLLGKQVPVAEQYAPELLYPIPRTLARERLGIANSLPFHGIDLWHAYEISWLDDIGKPVVRVGCFSVPATSPNMVESKSFKLYLNSLNNHVFATESEALGTITADIAGVCGEPVTLELFHPADTALAGTELDGYCLDELPVAVPSAEPEASILRVQNGAYIQRRCFSHLLRSLCPVTGQPDWATVWCEYRGREIDPESLLAYILAYRSHQEFHEQCVERMFCDVMQQCRPETLHIQAFYTRRGGLDINPFRSTDRAARPLPRLNRQ